MPTSASGPAPAAAPAAPPGAAGLRTFLTVWLGQTVSDLGSGLTAFSLGVWVYQRTGSVTLYGAILLFAVVPAILLSPLAGSVVDRYDRRLLMIGADTASALSTAAVAVLAGTGRLEVWHVYVAVGWSSLCMSVQRPAWASSVALLVPREQLGRAAGLAQLGQGAAQLLAPLLGGLLLVSVGLRGVILVDAATFVVGATATALVRIPRPAAAPRRPGDGLLHDAVEGWRYMVSRPVLPAVIAFLAMINLAIGFLQVLLAPMVLSFAAPDRLGAAVSAGSIGMIAGGVVMSATGGPARRIRGMVFAGWGIALGLLALGSYPSVAVVAAALGCFFFSVNFASACSQALLQGSVPPEIQGRVFATVKMLAWSSAPVAYLAAGPLASRVFTPLVSGAGASFPAYGAHPGGGPALLLAAVAGLMLASSLALHLVSSRQALEEEGAAPAPAPAAAVPAPG